MAMLVQVGVPAGASLFQGTCRACQHNFGVLLNASQAELAELRPKFCPICAGRLVYQHLEPA